MLGDILKFSLGAVAVAAVLLKLALGGFAAFRGASASQAPRAALATPNGSTPAPAFGDGPVVVGSNTAGRFLTDVIVDGARIRMVIDTGASAVALSAEDAERAGIHPFPGSYNQLVGTANGVVRAAQVELNEVLLGQIRMRGVQAYVLPRGATNVSLLGMTFLRRLSSFQLSENKMVLKP